MTVAPISTYPALLAEIADWCDRQALNDTTNADVMLNRPDLGPVAPTFVALAETQMRRRLDVRQMTATVTVTLDDESGFDLPCDFGGLIALVANPLSDGRYFPQLIDISQNALAEQSRVVAYGYAGQPRFYTVNADRIVFSPVQSDIDDDAPLQMTLTYRRTVPTLTIMNPRNWVLTSNPDVYLYGSLAHAAVYLKDNDLVGQMEAQFAAALEDVNMEGVRQRRGAVNRMRVGMVV